MKILKVITVLDYWMHSLSIISFNFMSNVFVFSSTLERKRRESLDIFFIFLLQNSLYHSIPTPMTVKSVSGSVSTKLKSVLSWHLVNTK